MTLWSVVLPLPSFFVIATWYVHFATLIGDVVLTEIRDTFTFLFAYLI